MKSTLPAGHLLRQYLLFVLTALFLLTMVRAGYALWQFPQLEETNAFVPLFVQGLRFDLALIGMICLVPVVIGSLLSMMTITRWLAKIYYRALFVWWTIRYSAAGNYHPLVYSYARGKA